MAHSSLNRPSLLHNPLDPVTPILDQDLIETLDMLCPSPSRKANTYPRSEYATRHIIISRPTPEKDANTNPTTTRSLSYHPATHIPPTNSYPSPQATKSHALDTPTTGLSPMTRRNETPTLGKTTLSTTHPITHFFLSGKHIELGDQQGATHTSTIHRTELNNEPNGGQYHNSTPPSIHHPRQSYFHP